MPQIYDMGPMALLPSEGRRAEEFFRPKNPTASVGFEPANLGTKGQHATPRPPKPISKQHIFKNMYFLKSTVMLVVEILTHNDFFCEFAGQNSQLSKYPTSS